MPRSADRRQVSESKVGHFDDSSAYSASSSTAKRSKRLAALGTSCPDHFLRTKILPLVCRFDPPSPDARRPTGLPAELETYRAGYAAYYDRCKRASSPAMRDPNAGVIWSGRRHDHLRARTRRRRGLLPNSMSTPSTSCARPRVSTYRGLPEQEAFDIEYWLLEEAKLQRMPKPKPLAGAIALITGGAAASASRPPTGFCSEGACVSPGRHRRSALAEAKASLAGLRRGFRRGPSR